MTPPRWYAAYTLPRHEKKVARQLAMRSLDFYLPLYTATHRWNDRNAELELPLFPGYVFVRIALAERTRALEVPSLLRLVSFGHSPLPLEDAQIDSLRTALAARKAEPYPFLLSGKRIRIDRGVFKGLEGVIERRKGRSRLIVSIELIERSIVIELEAADVAVIFPPKTLAGELK
jgi:transcription antitermination factor NusG